MFVLFCFREDYLFKAAVLRSRFDAYRNELDMRKAKELLRLGEEELFANLHTHPIKCKSLVISFYLLCLIFPLPFKYV